MAQSHRRKIEIFSAGCSTCNETVGLVERIAGSSHDIEFHDMHQAHVAARAKQQRNSKLAKCDLRRKARRVLRWART